MTMKDVPVGHLMSQGYPQALYELGEAGQVDIYTLPSSTTVWLCPGQEI